MHKDVHKQGLPSWHLPTWQSLGRTLQTQPTVEPKPPGPTTNMLKSPNATQTLVEPPHT